MPPPGVLSKPFSGGFHPETRKLRDDGSVGDSASLPTEIMSHLWPPTTAVLSGRAPGAETCAAPFEEWGEIFSDAFA